jgi:hypothetical protein
MAARPATLTQAELERQTRETVTIDALESLDTEQRGRARVVFNQRSQLRES